jgi:hypothetical protein
MTIVPADCPASGLTWMICGPVLPVSDADCPAGLVPAGGFEVAALGAVASGVETTISGA